MFRVNRNGAVNVIQVDGPLNVENGEAFCEVVNGTFSIGRPMSVIDLSGVPLMDSAGLEAVCEASQQHSTRGGQLKLARPQPLIGDILRVTGVAEQFEIHDDVATAVATFLR